MAVFTAVISIEPIGVEINELFRDVFWWPFPNHGVAVFINYLEMRTGTFLANYTIGKAPRQTVAPLDAKSSRPRGRSYFIRSLV